MNGKTRKLHVGSLIEMIRSIQKNHPSFGSSCSRALFKWVAKHAKDPKGSEISLPDFLEEIHCLEEINEKA